MSPEGSRKMEGKKKQIIGEVNEHHLMLPEYKYSWVMPQLNKILQSDWSIAGSIHNHLSILQIKLETIVVELSTFSTAVKPAAVFVFALKFTYSFRGRLK